MSFRAFWASKLTPFEPGFLSKTFEFQLNRLYKYTCWTSDRNAPFPLGYRNMHDRISLHGGRPGAKLNCCGLLDVWETVKALRFFTNFVEKVGDNFKLFLIF